jgi:hypothetical protein
MRGNGDFIFEVLYIWSYDVGMANHSLTTVVWEVRRN